jgi:hypothetical protein
MSTLQDFVDKLVPLQTELNAKIDEDLKQSKALAELENAIVDLQSQRSIIETDAANEGIAVLDLTAAVMAAINAPVVEQVVEEPAPTEQTEAPADAETV